MDHAFDRGVLIAASPAGSGRGSFWLRLCSSRSYRPLRTRVPSEFVCAWKTLETVPTLGGVFSIGAARAVDATRAVARRAFHEIIAAVGDLSVCFGMVRNAVVSRVVYFKAGRERT